MNLEQAELYQEKMERNHRACYCQMLKMKVLPGCLLEQYDRVKRLADRVDGFLSPGELALIAINAGFNPDTGKFPILVEETTEGEDARLQRLADERAAKPVGAPDEAADQVVEQTLEQTAEPPAQPAAQQQPAEIGKVWSPGMPVTVLHNDELKHGKIVGVQRPESGSEKAVQLTVEFEGGETVSVNEDEVEAD
jgi:hypothetical protein